MFVRLNVLHGVTRTLKLVPKALGACLSLTATLRDAFFMVNNDDLLATERVLANEGKTDAEIVAMKDTNWCLSCGTRHAVFRTHSSSCDGLTR